MVPGVAIPSGFPSFGQRLSLAVAALGNLALLRRKAAVYDSGLAALAGCRLRAGINENVLQLHKFDNRLSEAKQEFISEKESPWNWNAPVLGRIIGLQKTSPVERTHLETPRTGVHSMIVHADRV
jgi:hypothetical protein